MRVQAILQIKFHRRRSNALFGIESSKHLSDFRKCDEACFHVCVPLIFGQESTLARRVNTVFFQHTFSPRPLLGPILLVTLLFKPTEPPNWRCENRKRQSCDKEGCAHPRAAPLKAPTINARQQRPSHHDTDLVQGACQREKACVLIRPDQRRHERADRGSKAAAEAIDDYGHDEEGYVRRQADEEEPEGGKDNTDAGD